MTRSLKSRPISRPMMKRLAAAGAKVRSGPVPSIGAMRALIAGHGSLVTIEAYAEHHAILDFADANAWIAGW